MHPSATLQPVADPKPIFPIRLDDDEKAKWQAAAKEDGVDQLATWIKQVVRAHIKKQKTKKQDP